MAADRNHTDVTESLAGTLTMVSWADCAKMRVLMTGEGGRNVLHATSKSKLPGSRQVRDAFTKSNCTDPSLSSQRRGSQ